MHYQVGHWFTAHLFLVSCIHKPIFFNNFPCTYACQFGFFFFCNAWLTDGGLIWHTVSHFGTGMLQYIYIYFLYTDH